MKEDQPVDSPPPDFKKRASYHVAIAYNIHYLQLKNRGKLPDSMNPDKREIDAIDPTYYAKKIREKKNTDEVHEVNNPKADDYWWSFDQFFTLIISIIYSISECIL